MNADYNNVTAKNQPCFFDPSVKNTKATSVKPTINLSLVSLIFWDNLPKLCDVNTLLKFRLVSKSIYYEITNRTINSFCNKKDFNNYSAFSIETYNNLIKPNLVTVSPKLINSIEEYIQKFCKQQNFKKIFPKFLFYKMHHLGEILPKTFATTKKNLLNPTPLNSENPKFIKFFDLSPCGNYCITANKMKTITLFKITTGFDLKKLDTFTTMNATLRSIEAINFTPENNLCVIFSRENYRDDLSLYKINLNKAEDKYNLNKIAQLNLSNLIFRKAIMRCNDTKLILLTEQINNTHTNLELWELFGNQFIKKFQLDKSIIAIPYDYHLSGRHPVNFIGNLAVNKNANIMAMAVGKGIATRRNAICLLAINNEYESFIYEKIDKQDQLTYEEINSLFVTNDLQLTPSGKLCVFNNNNGFGITGLKRKNNTWHKIFTIGTGNYFDIQIMPYEMNLLVYREYRVLSDEFYKDIEIVPFTKNNRINNTKYSDNIAIKPKRYRNYFWQCDTDYGDLHVHPTGLAAFKFSTKGNYVDIMTLKQPTKLDTLARITKIVWQHC